MNQIEIVLIALVAWSVTSLISTNKTANVKINIAQIFGQLAFVSICIWIANFSKPAALSFFSLNGLLFYLNIQYLRFFGSRIRVEQLKHVWMERKNFRKYSGIVGNSFRTLARRIDLLLGVPYLLACAMLWNLEPVRLPSAFAVLGIISIASCYLLQRRGGQRAGTFMEIVFGVFDVGNNPSEDILNGAPKNIEKHDGKWFGKLKDKNAILIQLESFQGFLIGHKINGREVTPFLNKLARSGIYFSEIYSQYGMGHTADVELAVLQSLYPQGDEVTNYRHFGKRFEGLPAILSKNGYSTYAFHGFSGDGYNRRAMFKAFGFDEFIAREELVASDNIGFGISDVSFFKQIAEKLSNVRKPFFGFAITLTSHYPYVLPDNEKKLDLEGVPKELGEYFDCVNYTDRALETFWDELDKKGLLENTIVAMYGDHEGIVHRDIPALLAHLNNVDQIAGVALSAAKIAKIPFVIAARDAVLLSAHTSDQVGSAMDVGQTLLHLLGLPPITYGFGTDLFNVDRDRTVPLSAQLPGSFATRKKIFLVTTGDDGVLLNLASNSVEYDIEYVKHRRDFSKQQVHASKFAVQNDALVATGVRKKTVPFSPHVDEFISSARFERNAILIPFSPVIESNHVHALGGDESEILNFVRDISDAMPLEVALRRHVEINSNTRPIYLSGSDYIHEFRVAGYDITAKSGTRMSEYLRLLPDHCLIVVACADEAASIFDEEAVQEFREFGFSKLNNQMYRFSYVNMIYKNRGYISLIEEVAAIPLNFRFSVGQIVRGFTLPFSLQVVSVGSVAGNPDASIFIDGINHSKQLRGLNIVAIDMQRGEVVSIKRIDSCMTLFDDDAIYLARPGFGK